MGPAEMMVDVLFVEDSAGDALLTGQILAESLQQVKLHIARDGLQAMQMLSDPGFRPALIILDLRLPILSGHVVLERNQRSEIPIVVFSASWNQDDVSRAMAHGAREYVQKPIDVQAYRDAVLGMVEKWALRRNDAAEACG